MGFLFSATEVCSYFGNATFPNIEITAQQIRLYLLQCIIEKLDIAVSDDDVKQVFHVHNALDMLCSTGYRKPMESFTLTDKDSLKSSLLNYHLLYKVKCETDLFIQELETAEIVTIIRTSPDVFKGLFMAPDITSVTADDMKEMFSIDTDLIGDLDQMALKQTWLFFVIFWINGTIDCSVCDVLEFVSGSSSGFDDKP
uniref:Uncharacterized protein n=1 Tax=Amphimedon queenslandica TaxID=400682 RepID=A0A1X7V4W6_AMPQE